MFQLYLDIKDVNKVFLVFFKFAVPHYKSDFFPLRAHL